MSSNTGRIVIVLIVLAALCLFFLSLPKEPSDEIFQADKTTTIGEEPDWSETRLSSVSIYDGDIFFGGDDGMPHNIFFYYFSNIVEGVASAGIDANEYYFLFDPFSNEFEVVSDYGILLGRYPFTPGEISSEPVSFGEYNKDYYYYVSADRARMFLLLAAQEFPLIFGKNFWFKGTDSLDSGEIDRPYFYPAVDEFGYTYGKKAGTAIFHFDEDEDGGEDARLYVDTLWLTPIEANSRDSYEWQVVFLHNNAWLGFNLGGKQLKKRDSFGSVIDRAARAFIIKMPDRE